MKRSFRNVKYVNVSLKGFSLIDTVWLEEGAYGECLIYSGLQPAYLMDLISNSSGNFISEF